MSILRNLKISRKLQVLVVISALALMILGLVGYLNIKSMAERSEDIYENQLKPSVELATILEANRKVDAYLLEFMMTKDPQRNQELTEGVQNTTNEVDQAIKRYEQAHLTSKEKELLNSYKNLIVDFREARFKVVDLAKQNKNAEAYAIYSEEVAEKRNEINGLLDEMQALNKQLALDINEENKAALARSTFMMIIFLLVSLGLLIFIGILISRSIVRPVSEIRQLLAEAEEGDFTVKGDYESADEIGQLTASFNKMITTLRGIVSKVSDTSQQVAASSEELSASAEQSSGASEHISTAVQELAGGADHLVRDVDQSAQVVTEMNRYAQQIAANANDASKAVEQTSSMSIAGERVIQKATEQMGSINDKVTGLSNAVVGLNERSSEIGEINKVITDIAAQTNLLALNAAIEAARAGEQGRGFSVVADEVRKLAEQSANSAEQISSLIAIIQNDNQKALESMKITAAEVTEGLQVVQQAGHSFKQIKDSVSEVVGRIQDIARMVKQLSEGTKRVNQSIETVNGVAETAAANTQNISAATEEQLASMEEISASSSALAKMAEELQALIVRFKV
nr:methyl-accepting chemotaxis protein [Bacillus xiapuensis]